jgi:hypothetical protein
MLAEELPNVEFVQARSVLEWRLWPERLNARASDFALRCWGIAARTRRTGS